MVGDFLIAVSIHPVRLVVQWWKERFASYFQPSDDDSSDDSSNEATTSDVSSAFFASSAQHLRPSPRVGGRSSNGISNQDSHRYISGPNRKRGPSHEESIPVSRPSSSRQASRTLPTADNNNGEMGSSTSPTLHQIWYPPNASYAVNGIDRRLVDRTLPRVSVDVKEQVTILAEQQTDEWRQYPPFPSAYPPTPIATTSRLVSNSIGPSLSIYPPIPEELSSGFHKSPLLPRERINPIRDGSSGDHDHNKFGISPFPFQASDADDSISTDADGPGNEYEDDFNMTLKTPLQLNGSMRSRPHPNFLILPPPISAVSSNISVPSRSSALTSVDSGSPLRTDTCSDSSSAVAFDRLPASIVGKKRSYPRTAKAGAQVEGGLPAYGSSDPQHLSSTVRESRSITPGPRPQALERFDSVSTSDTADSIDVPHPASSSELNEDDHNHEHIAPNEKRRKVSKSLPLRTAKSPRPVRIRTSRISSPPRVHKHATLASRKTGRSGGSVPDVSGSPTKRRSGRLKAGQTAEKEEKRNTRIDHLSTKSLVEEERTMGARKE